MAAMESKTFNDSSNLYGNGMASAKIIGLISSGI
jgi:hypothetical protein